MLDFTGMGESNKRMGHTRVPIPLDARGMPLVRPKKFTRRVQEGEFRLQYEFWQYLSWQEPYGYLPKFDEYPAAHALMMYVIRIQPMINEARARYLVSEPIHRVQAFNVIQLCARAYAVEVQDMVKFWPAIDQQEKLLGVDPKFRIPKWARYPSRQAKEFLGSDLGDDNE